MFDALSLSVGAWDRMFDQYLYGPYVGKEKYENDSVSTMGWHVGDGSMCGRM